MSAFPIPVAPLYGALYFASIMSTAFYGVTCTQTFFYYIHYQDDPLRTKIFVAILWTLNTIHEVLIISGTYKYIISGLINPSSFVNAIPELIVQLLLMAPVAIPTQGFFVYRIYIFSDKNVVGPLIWIPLAIYQLVASFIYVAKALYTENRVVHVVALSTIGDDFFTAISVSYCVVASFVDVMIATFLTYLLVCKRVSTNFKSTMRVLERLTVFAINSGIWTAIFSLLTAIFVHVFPSNLIYAVFFLPLCSVYCNTLLANLNVRIYIGNNMTVRNIDTDLSMNVVRSGLRFSGPETDSKRVSSITTDSGVWKSRVVAFTNTDHSHEYRGSVKVQPSEA